jgi:hypothetical protein
MVIILGLFSYVLWGVQSKIFDAQAWQQVTGYITDSYVEERIDHYKKDHPDRTVYMPIVRYKYTIDGRVYESGQVKIPMWTPVGSIEYAESLRAPYLKGHSVTVFYNPKNPKEACLDLKKNVMPLWLALVMLGIALVLLKFFL